MDISQLKLIVGEAKEGEVATIRLFGRISEEVTSQFNAEFDFLRAAYAPS